MRLITSLLAVACIVSLAPAQWVEKTILIPDSLAGVSSPGTMLYNTGNNFLFVGGENGPAIIDGLSDRLIARASRAGLGPYAACYASQVNKLYWIGGDNGSRTFVLDGATGRDLAGTFTPNASSICYNPAVNRVYVTAHDTSGYVVVINAANDSVTRTLRLGIGYQPSAICDPDDNKVYVMSYLDGAVFVIDCTVDSIVDTIAVGSLPGQLVYNRVEAKLYCCSWDASVTVIDCRSDTVLARIELPGGVEASAFNPVANKLYCGDGAGISIISGEGDSLLGRAPMARSPRAMLCDSADNLMWCSSYSDTIYAIDGEGDSLCARVAVGGTPQTMCYNPARNRLYVENPHVTVVDPVERRVEKRILLSFHPAAVCWAGSSFKLYCAGRSEATVAVVSGSNQLLGLIPVGREPVALAYDRPLGVVCCADSLDSTVSIITCHGDSVTATVKVGPMPGRLCIDTILHKAWCSSESAVAVIDLQAESLTAIIPVPTYNIAALVADPVHSRVYCATAYNGHVLVLDAVGDSVVASIPVGGTAQNLALNPSANIVYCINQDNEAVAVIDGATLRVTNFVPVGRYPQTLLYNERRNKLYCANGYYYNDNTVTAIDCGTETPVATIELTVSPSVLAYDSVGDRLYCFSAGDYYVAVVDCRTDTRINLVRVGLGPVAAAYATQFRRLYVANEYGSSLSVIRDTVHSGVEAPDDLPAVTRSMPTIVRGVLFLPENGEGRQVQGELLNVAGCKVLDLKLGANDIRALAPGVYFVRGAQAQVVRKIVIAE